MPHRNKCDRVIEAWDLLGDIALMELWRGYEFYIGKKHESFQFRNFRTLGLLFLSTTFDR